MLHEPVPIRDVAIELKPLAEVNAVRLLRAGTALEFTLDQNGFLKCTIPELTAYEIVLFEQLPGTAALETDEARDHLLEAMFRLSQIPN